MRMRESWVGLIAFAELAALPVSEQARTRSRLILS